MDVTNLDKAHLNICLDLRVNWASIVDHLIELKPIKISKHFNCVIYKQLYRVTINLFNK